MFASPVRSLRRRSTSLPAALLAAWLAAAALLAAGALPGLQAEAPAGPAAAPDFGRLPMSFAPNRGQTDPAVRFHAQGAAGGLFFTPQEVVLSLTAEDALRLRFEGAAPDPELLGVDLQPGRVNYFLGDDPAAWRTDLPTYAGVVYRDLYPGIDLHYTGRAETAGAAFLLKGTYSVAPGADPGRIRWRYAGADSVRLDAAGGDLVIAPAAGAGGAELRERAPVAWQEIAGRRVPVDARYALAADGSAGFALGSYDPAYPLVIDPTLTYSTFLGGSESDVARGVAVDAGGNMYVTGQTASADFPQQNPAQDEFGGGTFGDAFVVKLNPAGTALAYATYLGGSGNDIGLAIAVGADGSAYVAGDTLSPDFPLVNAVQPDYGSGPPFDGDAFVARLDPAGSSLAYATFLGAFGADVAYGIAVGGDGSAYVTGYTSSYHFPTVDAVQDTPGFGQGLDEIGDAFVTQVVSASGVYTWGFSTFLGGTDWDEGHAIALDAAGDIYLAGQTRSTDYPAWRAPQPTYGGGGGFGRGDAFAAHLVRAGGVYTWGYSTYLGGDGEDAGWAIAVDDSGSAYVAGETASDDFPTLNTVRTAKAGGADAFVTQVITAGGVYTWGYSAYLGGGAGDAARGVAVDAGGDVYLAGSTASGDFPTTPDAYDFQCGSVGACDSLSQDAWYARLNLGGDELAYATYLGGSQDDQARALALGAGGDVYLAGQTSSPDFPARGGAYDSTCGSDGACNGAFKPDAFVARFGESGGGGRVYLPLVLKQASQAPAGCAPYYLAGIRVGDGPRGMAVDAARGRVYVANYVSGSLSAIDAESLTVIDSVPGLPYAQDAAYDAAHDLIWVTNHQAGTVTPIDAEILLPLAPVPVGDGPWGVAYDPVHDFVYVVNSVDETISVVDAETRAVTATLEGAFDQPFQAAANPVTGKVYITNFDGNSVTVIDGVSMNSVDLGEVTQPYGVAVDETRDLVYVASVEGHRVVAIGSDPPGTAPRVLNLAAVYRGNDPPRPVPLRAAAVHPGIGPAGDGGHLWLTSLIADGGKENLALLMPKGLPGYFAASVPYDLAASRTTDVEVDRARNRVYLSGGTASGEVTVLGDGTDVCLISLGERDALGVGVLRPGP